MPWVQVRMLRRDFVQTMVISGYSQDDSAWWWGCLWSSIHNRQSGPSGAGTGSAGNYDDDDDAWILVVIKPTHPVYRYRARF